MDKPVLTKYQLADMLIKTTPSLSKKKAVDVIEIIGDLIVCHFQNGGDRVVIRGFGSFRLRQRKSFRSYNPLSRKTRPVPENLSITFRPSRETSRRLNSGIFN